MRVWSENHFLSFSMFEVSLANGHHMVKKIAAPPMGARAGPLREPSLTLSQCTLAGPVYTGMPLVDPVYTGIPLEKLSWIRPTLECHWRNLVESAPHWDATGETLTFAAYTRTPLEGLWQPTHTPTHLSMQSSIHASLKWQDGGTPVSKWTGICIFSLYLEFTALQWMPVLLLTHVSTSTLLCACLWFEYHYSFCVFGVASQMKSV